jgi:hypothetical protein
MSGQAPARDWQAYGGSGTIFPGVLLSMSCEVDNLVLQTRSSLFQSSILPTFARIARRCQLTDASQARQSDSAQSPKLLDRLRAALELRKDSGPRIEEAVRWVARYIRFHGTRHPRELGPAGWHALSPRRACRKRHQHVVSCPRSKARVPLSP